MCCRHCATFYIPSNKYTIFNVSVLLIIQIVLNSLYLETIKYNIGKTPIFMQFSDSLQRQRCIFTIFHVVSPKCDFIYTLLFRQTFFEIIYLKWKFFFEIIVRLMFVLNHIEYVRVWLLLISFVWWHLGTLALWPYFI